MVNQSKIKDTRFWNIWRESGAVGTLQCRQTRSKDYVIEGDVGRQCGDYMPNSTLLVLGDVGQYVGDVRPYVPAKEDVGKHCGVYSPSSTFRILGNVGSDNSTNEQYKKD